MVTNITPLDVISVYIDGNLAFYARVEEILPDVKKGWLRMRFFVLNPALEEQELTWILEPAQIDGEEFTMGGTPIRIERLPDPTSALPEEAEGDGEGGKVISFTSRKG
ncbi:MAG: hypothetical protein C0609_10270 [Deltaproteobacteria bacterium]|mgnify:CR=1 FL=1|nr:MAG: hypothetical protein C0609_10270 [Deltaproteobacteria bacterium]